MGFLVSLGGDDTDCGSSALWASDGEYYNAEGVGINNKIGTNDEVGLTKATLTNSTATLLVPTGEVKSEGSTEPH